MIDQVSLHKGLVCLLQLSKNSINIQQTFLIINQSFFLLQIIADRVLRELTSGVINEVYYR